MNGRLAISIEKFYNMWTSILKTSEVKPLYYVLFCFQWWKKGKSNSSLLYGNI